MNEELEKRTRKMWVDEEDIILASIVIPALKNGMNQAEACEIAAESLPGRTVAACVWRWTNSTREAYEKVWTVYEMLKKSSAPVEVQTHKQMMADFQELTYKGIVTFLQEKEAELDHLQIENQALRSENERIQKELGFYNRIRQLSLTPEEEE